MNDNIKKTILKYKSKLNNNDNRYVKIQIDVLNYIQIKILNKIHQKRDGHLHFTESIINKAISHMVNDLTEDEKIIYNDYFKLT